MSSFKQFYSSVPGRLIVSSLIGAAVGYLIYLWRGNALAPWLCALASAALGLARDRRSAPEQRF